MLNQVYQTKDSWLAIVLRKMGWGRIVTFFPSSLYFVVDMLFKTNGRICFQKKRKKLFYCCKSWKIRGEDNEGRMRRFGWVEELKASKELGSWDNVVILLAWNLHVQQCMGNIERHHQGLGPRKLLKVMSLKFVNVLRLWWCKGVHSVTLVCEGTLRIS